MVMLERFGNRFNFNFLANFSVERYPNPMQTGHCEMDLFPSCNTMKKHQKKNLSMGEVGFGPLPQSLHAATIKYTP